MTTATCVNSEGSFVCNCPEGFDGDGISACTNVDECALAAGGRKRRQAVTNSTTEAANCDPTAICIDTEGSFTCVCPAGTVEDATTRQCQGMTN